MVCRFKMKSFLCVIFLTFWMVGSAGSVEVEKLFDVASALNTRGSSIGELMGRYKSETKKPGPEQRQADLALIWSMAETGSMCAILVGNVVGAAGMMDANSRESFMEIVNGSVAGCRTFVTEKVRFLGVLSRVRQDAATREFSVGLAQELQAMGRELDALSVNVAP